MNYDEWKTTPPNDAAPELAPCNKCKQDTPIDDAACLHCGDDPTDEYGECQYCGQLSTYQEIWCTECGCIRNADDECSLEEAKADQWVAERMDEKGAA